MTTLTLLEEATSGKSSAVSRLTVPESPLTAREIIRLRVHHEVEKRDAALDAEEQCRVAERAFERNGFLMFVGGRQILELDEIVEFAGDTEVSFLRLIPLVGG